MNKYGTTALSPTLSTVAATIFMAGLSIGNAYASESITAKPGVPMTRPYFSEGLPYVQAASALQISHVDHDAKFIDTVSDFYSRLLSEQRPMDQEFVELLSDNLWDLYAD